MSSEAVFVILIVALGVGCWIGYSWGYFDGWHKREPRMPLQERHRPPEKEDH